MKHTFTFRWIRMYCCSTLMFLTAVGLNAPSLAREHHPTKEIWADRSITGRVIDSKNQALPGVSVLIKGTTKGTTTDANGRFQLGVPDQGAVLQFSYIGYVTQEITVGNQTDLNVTLLDDAKSLNEVVVVGYGSQKKADITGAVSTVTSKDIGRLPVGGIDQALQGKAAGVRVTQSSGQPGEGVTVRIRGVGTINDNSPLYVIDGVPTKDPGSLLNPNDIESMSVLKDASSAAIYGARSANGVIVVTTKRGQSGAPRISFNSYTGFSSMADLIPMANTAEYAQIYNEAANTDNATIGDPTLYRKLITADPSTLPNTDWQRAIFRTAPMQNYQLSISGGTERSHYLISGNYFDQQGIILNSGYRRYALRTSLDTDIKGKVKIGTNINLTYANRSIVGSSGDGYGGNGGSIVRYALFRTPAIAVYDSTGNYTDLPARPDLYGDGYNPVGLANKQDNKQNQYRVFGNLFAEWQITKDLRFRTDGGLDISIINQKIYNENWGTNNRINSPATLSDHISTSTNLNWNNTLNYTHTFAENHDVSALLGMESIQNIGRDLTGSDRNFIDQDPNLRYLGRGNDPLGRSASEGDQRWKLLSQFLRVNYAYRNKYLATANIRRDGSSRFSPRTATLRSSLALLAGISIRKLFSSH